MSHQRSVRTIVLRTHQLHLVRREKSNNWQIHCKVNSSGEWLRRSTHTNDLERAKAAAEDLFHEVRVLEKTGLVFGSKKFKDIALMVCNHYKNEIQSGSAKRIYKDYIGVIENYLIPFFGGHPIGNINQLTMFQFTEWRKEKVKRELKSSTQKTHNAAFNAIYDYAIEKGIVPQHLKPKTINRGAPTISRGVFTPEEFDAINAYFPIWILQGRRKESREVRQILKLVVNFLAWTGARTGTEIEELKWHHLELIQQPNMSVIHITLPQGKVGSRTLIARNEIRQTLDQLRQLHNEFKHLTLDELLVMKVNKYVFSVENHSKPHPHTLVKNFSKFLKSAGILSGDASGKNRSLYSLRHFYATQRILEGINFGLLANQMGTSVLMLEKHYSHLKPLMIAEQLAGNFQGQH